MFLTVKHLGPNCLTQFYSHNIWPLSIFARHAQVYFFYTWMKDIDNFKCKTHRCCQLKTIKNKPKEKSYQRVNLSLWLWSGPSAWTAGRQLGNLSWRGLLVAPQWDWPGQRLWQRQRSHSNRPDRAAERHQPPLHRTTFSQVHYHQKPELHPLWHLPHRQSTVRHDLRVLQSAQSSSLVTGSCRRGWQEGRMWRQGKRNET